VLFICLRRVEQIAYVSMSVIFDLSLNRKRSTLRLQLDFSMDSTNPLPTMHRRVSHRHVLFSEILSVTSAMRKNSRWASSTHFLNPRDSALGSNLGLRISSPSYSSQSAGRVSQEADLMAGFQEIKRAVRDVEGT
jgi:brefeldin A-resistance guanine nucleotide exchange factor 1